MHDNGAKVKLACINGGRHDAVVCCQSDDDQGIDRSLPSLAISVAEQNPGQLGEAQILVVAMRKDNVRSFCLCISSRLLSTYANAEYPSTFISVP